MDTELDNFGFGTTEFKGGLYSTTFSEIPSLMLKIEISTFFGSFLGILRAYFEKCHKIKVVQDPKLGLITFLLTL